jgi:hypothetical protein
MMQNSSRVSIDTKIKFKNFKNWFTPERYDVVLCRSTSDF